MGGLLSNQVRKTLLLSHVFTLKKYKSFEHDLFEIAKDYLVVQLAHFTNEEIAKTSRFTFLFGGM